MSAFDWLLLVAVGAAAFGAMGHLRARRKKGGCCGNCAMCEFCKKS